MIKLLKKELIGGEYFFDIQIKCVDEDHLRETISTDEATELAKEIQTLIIDTLIRWSDGK